LLDITSLKENSIQCVVSRISVSTHSIRLKSYSKF